MVKLKLGSDKVNRLKEIKLGLELWDNRHPIEPPSDKNAEILYHTVRLRARAYESNAVESVRYLLSIIEQAETALNQFTRGKYYRSVVSDVWGPMVHIENEPWTIAEEALQAIRGN
jgi:hypothetical protein